MRELWHKEGRTKTESDMKKLEIYLENFLKSLDFLEEQLSWLKGVVKEKGG